MHLEANELEIQIFQSCIMHVKFRLSEKDTKFEKIFHLEFDAKSNVKFLSGRFFQILCPSQKV